jgi:hypothetical protein
MEPASDHGEKAAEHHRHMVRRRLLDTGLRNPYVMEAMSGAEPCPPLRAHVSVRVSTSAAAFARAPGISTSAVAGARPSRRPWETKDALSSEARTEPAVWERSQGVVVVRDGTAAGCLGPQARGGR